MVAAAGRAGLIALGLVVLLALASRVQHSQTVTADMATLFPGGELRIGVDLSLSPLVQVQDGQPVGLVAELGRELARDLQLSPRFIPVSQDGRFDALRLGRLDLLMAVDSRRAAAEHDVLATRPWFNAGLVLVSLAEHAVPAMQDLAGRSLALALGSAADVEARRWRRRIAAFEVLPYELPDHALEALRLGVADAALVNALDARLYLRHLELAVEVHQASEQHLALALLSEPSLRWQVVDRSLGRLLETGFVTRLLDSRL